MKKIQFLSMLNKHSTKSDESNFEFSTWNVVKPLLEVYKTRSPKNLISKFVHIFLFITKGKQARVSWTSANKVFALIKTREIFRNIFHFDEYQNFIQLAAFEKVWVSEGESLNWSALGTEFRKLMLAHRLTFTLQFNSLWPLKSSKQVIIECEVLYLVVVVICVMLSAVQSSHLS